MNVRKQAPVWLVGLVAMLALILPLSAVLAANEMLPRFVVNSSGASLRSGGIGVRSAVGQPASGAVAVGNTILCSGFNCAPLSQTPVPTPTGSPIPTGSPTPSGSITPDASGTPSGSATPDASGTPDASATPGASATPDGSTTPVTSTTPGVTPTPPGGSTSGGIYLPLVRTN